jgi:RNA polymerase sigma-70 factor (TIGR02957 family)
VSEGTEGRRRDDVSSRTGVFEALRPHLMGVAYRMLGSVSDAEDVVQEAWLRWSRTDPAAVKSPEAFLTTVVARLAVDHLRHLRSLRQAYIGPWLPEPVRSEADPSEDPEHAVELADSLSMAFLVVLETLSPLERAAFVLREVFERPYAEVAATIGRTESAARQLVHRARARVAEGHARYQADRATHAQVVQQFLEACQGADVSALMEVLAPDVLVVGDGGGLAQSPRRPVFGRDKVARLMAGIATRAHDASLTLEVFNGSVGIVARRDGVPIGAVALASREGLVHTVHLLANPQKLSSLSDLTTRIR